MQNFRRWLAEQGDRDILTPDQKVVPTVAAAGSGGLTRRELMQRFERELSRETLWELLAALVGVGDLVAVNDGDDVRYMARTAMSG